MEIIHSQEKLILVSGGDDNKSKISDDNSEIVAIIAFSGLGVWGARLFQKNELLGAAIGASVGYGITKLPLITPAIGDVVSGVIFSPFEIL